MLPPKKCVKLHKKIIQQNTPPSQQPHPSTSPILLHQVCGADWSPSGLLARVAADGAFHALIDTGAERVR